LADQVKDTKLFSKYVFEFLPPIIIPSVLRDVDNNNNNNNNNNNCQPVTAESWDQSHMEVVCVNL
jgi:hypothetical protein